MDDILSMNPDQLRELYAKLCAERDAFYKKMAADEKLLDQLNAREQAVKREIEPLAAKINAAYEKAGMIALKKKIGRLAQLVSKKK